MLVERTSKGESISAILLSLNHKDAKFAQELLFADDELSKITRSSFHGEEPQQEESRPRVFNKTKLMRQEAEQIRAQQEQELQQKIRQLQLKWSA